MHAFAALLLLAAPAASAFHLAVPQPPRAATRLDGIAGLHRWTATRFPDAVRSVSGDRRADFDHVCVDLNQLVHTAANAGGGQAQVIARTTKLLTYALRKARPRKSVVLALDGAAPLAKLLTQRRRRFHSVRKGERQARLEARMSYRGGSPAGADRAADSAMEAVDSGAFSPLAITPGTTFMAELSVALERWAWRRLDRKSVV